MLHLREHLEKNSITSLGRRIDVGMVADGEMALQRYWRSRLLSLGCSISQLQLEPKRGSFRKLQDSTFHG